MQRVSSERRALVEAIRRAPSADGPRIDAAKWFENQGDPASVARAEFIRVQLDRARLASGDPAQHELAARELRLLREWSSAWSGAHPALRKCAYRRGFVEYVHVHARTFLPWRKQLFALEPIRDVRITGLYRPSASIVDAVARCDEWKHVDTLRFHHQGPHHEPRQELLSLLASPKLTSLRRLYGTQFQMNAEGRRRIERLALFEKLEALAMPSFETFPEDPGAWFQEGEVDASKWMSLREFDVPESYSADEIARWWSYPWWPQLTALRFSTTTEALANLVERLPRELQTFEGYINSYRYNEPGPEGEYDALFDALAERPLRSMRMSLGQGENLAGQLTRTLRDASRWALHELVVPAIDADLVTVIGTASATRHLRSISSYCAAPVFDALAASEGPSLESLALATESVDSEALARALAGSMARSVSWLTLSGFELDATVADALCSMEHLAVLRLRPSSAQSSVIEKLESHFGARAWLSIEREDEPWPEDEEGQRVIAQRMRAERAPERMPPLDAFVPRL